MISYSLRVASRALVLVGLGLALALASQSTKPAFEMDLFAITQEGFFEPFYVTETQPLRQALDDGTVAGDDRVLVTETAGGRLAVLTDQM